MQNPSLVHNRFRKSFWSSYAIGYIFLRQCIVEHESIVFYNEKGLGNEVNIKLSYNQMVKSEFWVKYNLFSNLKRLDYFKEMYAVNDHLIAWNDQNVRS